MDDLFLMSPSPQQTQTLLDGASAAQSWVCISVNPSKSRNLVFEKGKVLNENVLSIIVKKKKEKKNNCFIPSIPDKPAKFLGRTISLFIR